MGAVLSMGAIVNGRRGPGAGAALGPGAWQVCESPWERIARAAERGTGVRLSAADVRRLAAADADRDRIASADAALARLERAGGGRE